MKLEQLNLQTLTGATHLGDVTCSKALIYYQGILVYSVNDSNAIKTYKYVISTETETLEGTMSSSLGTPTYSNVIVREFSGVVYIFGSWQDDTALLNADTYEFAWDTYTISTDTYAADDSIIVANSGLISVPSTIRGYCVDIVAHNSTYYIVYSYTDVIGTTETTFCNTNNITKTDADSASKGNLLYWFFGGWYDTTNSRYYWCAYRNSLGAEDWIGFWYLDAGVLNQPALTEGVGIETNTDPDMENSDYIDNGLSRCLSVNYHLYMDYDKSDVWADIALATSNKNTPLWRNNGSDEYVASELIFNSVGYYLYGHSITPFQKFTDTNYYAGCEKYLVSDRGFYELEFSTYKNNVAQIINSGSNYVHTYFPYSRTALIIVLDKAEFTKNNCLKLASQYEESYGIFIIDKILDREDGWSEIWCVGIEKKDFDNVLGSAFDYRQTATDAPDIVTDLIAECDAIVEGTISTTPATTRTPNLAGLKLSEALLMQDQVENYRLQLNSDGEFSYTDGKDLLSYDYKRRVTGVVQWGTAANPSLGDWTDASSILSVESEYDGHKNILKATWTAGNPYAQYSLGAQITDTLEFLVGTSSANAHRIYIRDSGSSLRIYISIKSTEIRFYYGNGAGGSTSVVYTPSLLLTHVQISYNCTTDKYTAYANGILMVNNQNFYNDLTSTTMNEFRLYLPAVDTPEFVYFDGLGLQSQGYTPRSLLWTPSNGTGCTTDVVDFGGRYRVNRLHDNGNPGTALLRTSITNGTTGKIIYYLGTSDVTKVTYYYIWDGGSANSIYFYINTSSLIYDDGSAHIICSIDNDTLYKIEIEWDCSSTWTLKVNDVAYGPFAFKGSPIEMDLFEIVTFTTLTGYYSYVDVVYCSWQPQLKGYNEEAGVIWGRDIILKPQPIELIGAPQSILIQGGYLNGSPTEGSATITDDVITNVWKYYLSPYTNTTELDAIAATLLSYLNTAIKRYSFTTFDKYPELNFLMWFKPSATDPSDLYLIEGFRTYPLKYLTTFTVASAVYPVGKRVQDVQDAIKYVESVTTDINPSKILFTESADPDNPASGYAVMWVDANGDLKIKINHGGSVKTATLADFSAL